MKSYFITIKARTDCSKFQLYKFILQRIKNFIIVKVVRILGFLRNSLQFTVLSHYKNRKHSWTLENLSLYKVGWIFFVGNWIHWEKRRRKFKNLFSFMRRIFFDQFQMCPTVHYWKFPHLFGGCVFLDATSGKNFLRLRICVFMNVRYSTYVCST